MRQSSDVSWLSTRSANWRSERTSGRLGIAVATIAVGSGPQSIAVTPSGSPAYVVNVNSANVTVVNASTNAVVAIKP